MDKLEIASIVFVGDLMCHAPQFEAARVPGAIDSFDFSKNYLFVKQYISQADFAIGNLETTIAGAELRYTGYPCFNTPYDYLGEVKKADFDFLVTSNNHSFDRGKKGVTKTIDSIKKLELGYTGTFDSFRDRDSIRIIEIKGIKIAIIAFSYGVNGNNIPKVEKYLVNIIDTNLIKKDILEAKKLNPDIILTYFHFGDEYKREPSLFQKEIVKKTISYGADIIIGSHPHVIQPIDYFKGNNNLDTGFVAYSLGNFISNQRDRYKDSGLILKFTISKSKNKVYLGGVEYLPTWVFKGKYEGKDEYLILANNNIKSADNYLFLPDSDKIKMRQSFMDSEEIINKYSNKQKIILR
ncbi:MAG: CapA family protein [bacterium]